MRIDLYREGQKLSAMSPPLFDGSVGVVTVRVNDRCGEDKVSALRFYTDESDIYSVDITDGEARVPHEVIKTPGFTIAAAYYKADGENVERFLPTAGVFIPVMKNGYGAPDDAIEGENAAPSVLAQLLERTESYTEHRAAEVIDHPDGSVTAAKLAAKSIGREKLTDALAAELDKKADSTDVGTALAAKADKATTLAGYGIGDAVGVSVSYEDKLDTLVEKGVYHVIDRYSPGTGEAAGSDWTDYYVIVCPRTQSIFSSDTVPAQIRIKGELISTRYKYLTTPPGGKSWSEWVTLANVSDMNTALDEKVNKESGKGLSSNDYTDEEKAKLADLPDSSTLAQQLDSIEKCIDGKVDKEDGKGLSDAASVSVYHATGGNEVLQLVGQDGVTKLTAFYGKQAVDDQMSAFSLGLSTKVDKDVTGMRGLSNAKDVNLLDSASEASELEVTDHSGSSTSSKYYNSFVMDKMLAKLREQSVPHTEVSDYPVTLTDALAGESLRGLKVYGGCGKNLLPYPYSNTTKTVNGITFTDNGDGTITANGTATADAQFNCTIGMWFEAGVYTVSGCPAGGSSSTYFTALGAAVNADVGAGKAVTYQERVKRQVFIVVKSGTTVENITFKPQVEAGSTATAWEQYKEVGDADGDAYKIPLRLQGKNIIPYPYADTTKTINGITFTVFGDGRITVNGTATGQADFIVISSLSPVGEGGEQYTLSGCPTGGSQQTYGMFYYDTVTSQYDTGDGVSFTAKGVISVTIRIREGAVCNNLTFSPMLESGAAVTGYEPYITPQVQTATLTSPLTSGEYIDVLNKKLYSDGTISNITVDGEIEIVESERLTIDCATEVQPLKIETEYWQDINKAINMI